MCSKRSPYIGLKDPKALQAVLNRKGNSKTWSRHCALQTKEGQDISKSVFSPSTMKDLHKEYAELMKHHPEGHALYIKQSTREINPGMCGLFNYDGRWNPIVQLTNKKALETGNWTPLQGFRKQKPQGGIYLTAKTAKSTSGVAVATTIKSKWVLLSSQSDTRLRGYLAR
jgi:hypothetical protein